VEQNRIAARRCFYYFPSENQQIALQFVGGRPMAAPTMLYPTERQTEI